MKVTYSQPALTLDYTALGALDRFNRITDHAWKNSSNVDIVRIKHGYDRVGNRLYREDVVAANNSKSFDELYQYDGMNQLIDMQRGTLNTAKTTIASGKNYQDNFTFDATGNWTTYKQDTTGAGFSLTQARTHNKANEILTVAGATTHVASDANGNMTKCVKPDNWSASFTLVYDAWNRLVIVKDTNNTTIVATYSYDALNRRVRKVVGNETRTFYFNNAWQCVEEYVGGGWKSRYIWGLRYVDDLIMRDMDNTGGGSVTHRAYSLADANWNVVAITNTSGTVQERYTYSAFGKLNILDAAFTTRAASACNVTRTFTGQVLDNETGLMLYRNRVYHPTLGRFLQRDPIGYEAEDENLYRYVFNNSLLYADPDGNSPLGLACAGACGAVVVCVAPGAIACAATSSSPEEFGNCMKIYWDELPTWEKWACGILTVACIACLARALAKQLKKNHCKILKLAKEGACRAAAGAGSCTEGRRGKTCKCYSSEGFAAIAALWTACSSARSAYTFTCFKAMPGNKDWDGHIRQIKDTARVAAKCLECAAEARAQGN